MDDASPSNPNPQAGPPTAPGSFRYYEPAPEPEPRFWGRGWFKLAVFLLVAGTAGGWLYYNYVWRYRLPQEREVSDAQGNILRVRMLGHDDLLLKYAASGSETVRYMSLATLAPSDQEFIGKLASARLAKLPLNCTLTDGAGKETAVRVLAHDNDWARCALIADGATTYVYLPALSLADQAVIRLLPANLSFEYPAEYTLTGPPTPEGKVQFLGRHDDLVEYLDMADGRKHFMEVAGLSKTDQSFVRELPGYMLDQPPAAPSTAQAAQDNNPPPETTTTAPIANNKTDLTAPIDAGQLNALVIIEGDYGAGSGFITKMHDQYFVVTNQHVLSGNTKFTITTVDGKKLPITGPLYGAVGYDVAILKIPDSVAEGYLEVLEDAQKVAKVNDPITVAGNSRGARVPVQINGKLLGIGPELVELSSELQHGISGSPIIDRMANKVIGVATMSITYRAGTARSGLSTETRWFGYRVDNIDPNKGWVKLDWARYSAEGIKVRDALDLYKSLSAVIKDEPMSNITNPLVHQAVMGFISEYRVAISHNNRMDLKGAFPHFNQKLRSLADNGVSDLVNQPMYPYHKEIVQELDEVRKYMDEVFVDSNEEYNSIMGKSK